jgi:uncharacterized protein YbjT (DUF2867 family)
MSEQEPEKEPEQPKKPVKKPRAHASGHKVLKKAAKKLAKLLHEIPDEFVHRALERLGEQLDATKPIWDVVAKQMIDIPDERIRQEAAAMILAYKWGTPVARAITAHGDVDDFAAMLAKAQQSPAALESLQKTVEGKEILELTDESPSGQNDPSSS